MAANKSLLDELGKLYQSYLAGDAVQVKNSLLEEIRVIEGAEWLPPQDKANLLFITHARLYVFHHTLNEESAAEAAWIKLRFWLLRRGEFGGLEPRAAMTEIGVFTPEKIVETIHAWDRRENNGQLPQYHRSVLGSPDQLEQ